MSHSIRRQVVDILNQLNLIQVVNELRGASSILKPQTLSGNIRHRLVGAEDQLPIPPTRLIYKVSNIYDVDTFLRLGALGYQTVIQTLQRNRITPDMLQTILDFGCGCGRVTRHFKQLPMIKVYGSDYNHQAIQWCRKNLDFAKFSTNQLEPPLSYEDSSMDLVWAFSVFTHLSKELHYAWLEEILRILKPGGYLMFSAHGDSYRPQLSNSEQAMFDNDQLVIRLQNLSGKNLCNAFYTENFVRNHLTRGFSVVDFIPEGALGNPTQDIYLLRAEK